MTRSSILILFTAALATACATPNALENFRHPEAGGVKRAAYEMQCPESELEVTDLGGWTIGVSGCGKRAVYKWAYGAGWVNNTAVDEPAVKSAKSAK